MLEYLFGTDKDNRDTDGDGLLDGFEYSFLTTDLLLADTDGNGVSDADEDFDGDGLSEIREQEAGTRPDKYDSDGDGARDGAEIDAYSTDPLNADSDGDGLSDGEEIILGLDPNNPFSDGFTPDGSRLFAQTAGDATKSDALLSSGNWLIPSVSGAVPGLIDRRVRLEMAGIHNFSENRSVLSDAVALSTTYTMPLNLVFTLRKAYIGDERNLAIASYMNGELQIIETERLYETDDARLDGACYALSGEITGAGIYFVVDLYEFLKGIGVDVMGNLEPQTDMNRLEPQRDANELEPQSDANGDGESEGDGDTGGDGDGRDWAFARKPGAMGQADVIFVIDTTGSMGDAIRNVKNNIYGFARNLAEDYNIDAHFALVEYRDIDEDGSDSTRVHDTGISNWFMDAEMFMDEIGRLSVDGGGDEPETPIDGLETARRLDFRSVAAKLVILVTDAPYKNDNNYGIADMSEMSDMFANDGVCVSVIGNNKGAYGELIDKTGGVYGNINGNFNDLLTDFAKNFGNVANTGEWLLLDDYQVIKLPSPISLDMDTDADGLADRAELDSPFAMDMSRYIDALLRMHDIPRELYIGESEITAWSYISNPILPDTDFDGMPDGGIDFDGGSVTPDPAPRDNAFTASPRLDVDFNIDYSIFFKNGAYFNRDLAAISLLYASDFNGGATDDTGGATDDTGGGGPTGGYGALLGLKDIENIALDGSAEGAGGDGRVEAEVMIGRRTVVYRGAKRDVIFVATGCVDWSRFFDIGADTDAYYAANGADGPRWVNKLNHKGFDVAANRVIDEIDGYVARHVWTAGAPKAILLTGVSGGAAIANILGAHYERTPGYVSYAYAFNTPNTTTDAGANNYQTIFNIIDHDNVITKLPLANWGFTKYGADMEIYEIMRNDNIDGKAANGAWKFLSENRPSFVGSTARALDALGKIADNRGALYERDASQDGTARENDAGFATREEAEIELAELERALKDEKLLKYCLLDITGGDSPEPYYVEIHYCPAYAVQILANLTAEADTEPERVVWPRRRVVGKYARAVYSFIASNGAWILGDATLK